jgi:hypothetical protein
VVDEEDDQVSKATAVHKVVNEVKQPSLVDIDSMFGSTPISSQPIQSESTLVNDLLNVFGN